MPVAHVNGIDLWYEFRGEGPLLVLNHGFAGPTAAWPPIVDELTPHYRLLLYDIRGHGRTSVPPDDTFSMPQYAADLAALLDVLGVESACVGGVSMGGMVAAQFACDFPQRVRALLLCDTTAGNCGDPQTAPVERHVVDIFHQYDRIVRKHGLRGLAERENRYRHEADPFARYSAFSLDEQDERNTRNKLENMTEAGYLAAARALRERPDLTQRTPKIAAPTLVSCGEWDLFYPLALRDHYLIPGSRLVTIRRAAHDTLNYAPQKWKQAVLDFLRDVEQAIPVAAELEL